jgi:uncharacterized protein YecT (DUF1311 family)
MTNLAQLIGAGYLALALLVTATATGRAQDTKPTPQQTTAIRACAEKNQNDVTEAERQCLFNLVATPCQNTPEGQSNLGMADCFRLEAAIWDGLLNDNFRQLRNLLDIGQLARARDMQRAWIASRDATCGFYDVKIQGSMAIPMAAACLARETARRALLLKLFTGL